MSDPHKFNPQFYFTYLNELNTRPTLASDNNKERKDVQLEIPYLTESGFHSLVNKINILKVSMSKKCKCMVFCNG